MKAEEINIWIIGIHFKARSPTHGWLQFSICQKFFPTKRDNSFMQTHYPAGKEGLFTHQPSSLSLYFHMSIIYSTVFSTDFSIFLDINPQAI